MSEDAGPSVLTMLRNKGKSATGRDHANEIPSSHLDKEMKTRPEQAMVEPGYRAARKFLAWQQISSPPQLFPGNVTEEKNDRIINGDPPMTSHRKIHEAVGARQPSQELLEYLRDWMKWDGDEEGASQPN